MNSESLCAPGDQPKKEREMGREGERERKKDTGTKALMEQRCFIAIFSRDKIKTYKLSRKDGVIHMKERGLQIITFTIWFIRRKRVLITL